MTVIVKCDLREIGSDDLLTVGAAWLFENCALQEGDEIFVWWHKSSNQRTHLAVRGTLSRFEHLPKSSRGLPQASLQIKVEELLPNERSLTLDHLKENATARPYKPSDVNCMKLDEGCIVRCREGQVPSGIFL
jgi:hypothetical protein